MNFQALAEHFAIVYSILTVRYVVLAGLAYLIIWKLLGSRLAPMLSPIQL
mgnify:CR=1 FL=1